MRKMTALLTAILFAFVTSISAANSTFIDYQNYNHGYCPSCNYEPCVCDPPPYQDAGYPPCTPPYPAPCPPEPPCEPPCDPCDPCAPVCGTDCGVSVCAIAVAVAAVIAAAAIVLSSGSGVPSSH